MRILVIAAHPNIEQSRVNKRWLEELHGYPDQITVQELYKTYPDYEINARMNKTSLQGTTVLYFNFQSNGTVCRLYSSNGLIACLRHPGCSEPAVKSLRGKN